MSQSNAEIARAAVEAWNGGDDEVWLAVWDEAAEFYPLRAQLEGRAYLGHDGVRRFVAELADDWATVRFDIEATHDVGDQVVGIGRFRATGRWSGVELDNPFGVVSIVRDGKVVYSRFYSDPEAALEAAGRHG